MRPLDFPPEIWKVGLTPRCDTSSFSRTAMLRAQCGAGAVEASFRTHPARTVTARVLFFFVEGLHLRTPKRAIPREYCIMTYRVILITCFPKLAQSINVFFFHELRFFFFRSALANARLQFVTDRTPQDWSAAPPPGAGTGQGSDFVHGHLHELRLVL